VSGLANCAEAHGGRAVQALHHDRAMKRWFLVLLLLAGTGCLGLPNPQSEWTTSEGGEQRSTFEDTTVMAGNTIPSIVADDDDDGVTPVHFQRHLTHHVFHTTHHVTHAHVARAHASHR